MVISVSECPGDSSQCPETHPPLGRACKIPPQQLRAWQPISPGHEAGRGSGSSSWDTGHPRAWAQGFSARKGTEQILTEPLLHSQHAHHHAQQGDSTTIAEMSPCHLACKRLPANGWIGGVNKRLHHKREQLKTHRAHRRHVPI